MGCCKSKPRPPTLEDLAEISDEEEVEEVLSNVSVEKAVAEEAAAVSSSTNGHETPPINEEQETKLSCCRPGRQRHNEDSPAAEEVSPATEEQPVGESLTASDPEMLQSSLQDKMKTSIQNQEEHSNEEHKAKPQAFSRAAVLESASLHAALEPIELKHVTSQITPGINGALFCKVDRSSSLLTKMTKMTSSRLRFENAMRAAQVILPDIVSCGENAILVLALEFERGRLHQSIMKDGNYVQWPPSTLDSLDCCRQGVQHSYRWLSTSLDPAHPSVDSIKESFGVALQQLLLNQLIPNARGVKHVAGDRLATEELYIVLNSAAELTVSTMMAGVEAFMVDVERILDESYTKVCASINTELDASLVLYFNRYDLEKRGTINSVEVLDNLCTNISYKYAGYVVLPELQDIREHCRSQDISEQNAWDLQLFLTWFNAELRGTEALGYLATPHHTAC